MIVRKLTRLALPLVIVIGFLALGYLQLMALDNQRLIWEKASPDTVIKEGASTHVIEHHYAPTYAHNETMHICPEPWADLVLNDTRHYIGIRVEFHVQFSGCVESIHITGKDGVDYWMNHTAYSYVIYHYRGVFDLAAEVQFTDGSSFTSRKYFYVNPYAPPVEAPDPLKPMYKEWNPLEQEGAVFHLQPWLSDATPWNQREVASAHVLAWSEGVPNPGFSYGLNGVSVNAYIYSNVENFAGGLVTYDIWKTAPHPSTSEIGSCRNGYESTIHPDVLSTPVGQQMMFFGRPVGCNVVEFSPGEIMVYIEYEYDGVITEGLRDYEGPDGPGYLYDEPDFVLEFSL